MLQFVFIFFQIQRCIISLFSLLEHILWENITCIGARWVHLPWYVKPSKAGEYLTDSILHQVAQMLNSVAALLLREPELTKDDARKKAFLSISISQALSFVQRGLDGEKNQRRGDYSLCRSIYPAVLYHTAMMHEIVNILKSFPPYWVNVCFFVRRCTKIRTLPESSTRRRWKRQESSTQRKVYRKRRLLSVIWTKKNLRPLIVIVQNNDNTHHITYWKMSTAKAINLNSHH